MRYVYVIMVAAALTIGCKRSQEKSTSADETSAIFKPYVEKVDEQLDEIIDPGAEVEVISEGYDWSEGPLWIEGLGLLFSDIPPNRVYLWSEEQGTSVYLEPSGYTGSGKRGGEVGSNGLLLDNKGQLVLCQHGDRRVARMQSSPDQPRPVYETIIDQFEGKKLNSPNDACFNKVGDLYFTDPPYGLEKNVDDPLKELDFQGVYRYSVAGDLMLLTKNMSRPNGIAFSPDEKKLYVANSDPNKAIWMEYKLDENGLIKEEKVFYDATALVGKEAGLPDGLKVDKYGNVFATGPGGVWIFDINGNVLGKVRTGQATSNCAIGNNGKMLYITADMYVMKVALKG